MHDDKPRPDGPDQPDPMAAGQPHPAGPLPPDQAGPAQADGPATLAGGTESSPDTAEVRSDADLLAEMAALRQRARSRRHAYWFPLILFGALICLSAPFYYPQQLPPVSGPGNARVAAGPLPSWFLRLDLLRPISGGRWYTALYWLVVLACGFALTAWWYRRNGRRTGLMTSARGYLVTGVVLLVLTLAVPSLGLFLPGNLVIRGLFPLLIIAAGLWVLARAERSPGLAAIAAVYTAVALVSNLYNVGNLTYRLGIILHGGWGDVLPNVLPPAAVLLVAGAGAYAVQRRTASR
jgi:hypothetical protein